jgi:hypothetical protein
VSVTRIHTGIINRSDDEPRRSTTLTEIVELLELVDDDRHEFAFSLFPAASTTVSARPSQQRRR